jgi:hypothetical protein
MNTAVKAATAALYNFLIPFQLCQQDNRGQVDADLAALLGQGFLWAKCQRKPA